MHEQAPPELARTVVRGAGLAGAGFVLSRALTLAAYLVLARLAAPSAFGQYAAGAALVGVGGVFVESGLVAAVIQRRDRAEEAASTAFAAVVLAGFLLTGVAAALSPVVGLVFGSHTIGMIALAVSGLVAVGAFKAVPDAIMQRRFSFLRRVVADPIGVAAFAVVSIVAVAEGLGPWGLVLGAYAGEIALAAAGWLLCRWRPNFRLVTIRMWRELARYGRFVLAGETLDHVGTAANAVLLGRFVSTGALGQYRYAQRFGMLPHELVVNAASYVLMPAFSRISAEQGRFADAYRRSLRWLFTLVLPWSMLLLPLGSPFVLLLLGERWRAAGGALMALCAGSAARAANSVAAAALKGAGRPQALPLLHFLNVGLGIALMAAFLPLGIAGVAGGATIAAVVSGSYGVLCAARVSGAGTRWLVPDLGTPILAAAVMVGLLFPLDRLVVHSAGRGTVLGLILLAAEAAAGVAVYSGALLAFSSRARSELPGALRALRRHRHPSPGWSPAGTRAAGSG
jgi:PST family polysaccharide transporter